MVSLERPGVRWSLAIVAWLALLVLATWPAFAAPWTHAPGVPRGDLWNTLWGVGFVGDALGRGELPWRTDLLAAPDGGVLWVADPVGAIAMAAMERVLPPPAAYAFVTAARLVGAAAAMSVFARAWLAEKVAGHPRDNAHSWLAGGLAGAILMLAAPLTMCLRNGTSEGTDGLALVLAVHAGWHAARSPGARPLWILAGATALACAAQPYGALVAGMALGALLVTDTTPLRRRLSVLAVLVTVGTAWAGLVSGLLHHPDQLARGAQVTTNTGPPGGADLAGWWSHTCGARPRPGPDGQLAHCLALPPLVLLLGAVGVARARATAMPWVLLAATSALFATGTAWSWHGHPVMATLATPWSLLPEAVVNALGQPWRLSLGAWFAVAMASTRALPERGWLRGIVLVASAAALAGPLPETHRPEAVDTTTSPALLALADGPPGAVLAYPLASARRALWDQRTHHHPLLLALNEGRSARAAAFLDGLAALPRDPGSFEGAVARLGRKHGVRYLVARGDYVARSEPAHASVEALLERLPPVGQDDALVRVRALW